MQKIILKENKKLLLTIAQLDGLLNLLILVHDKFKFHLFIILGTQLSMLRAFMTADKAFHGSHGIWNEAVAGIVWGHT